MNCPHCGQQHQDNIKFCPKTGQKMQQLTDPYTNKNFCIECGTANNENHAFCNKCGENLQVQQHELVGQTTILDSDIHNDVAAFSTQTPTTTNELQKEYTQLNAPLRNVQQSASTVNDSFNGAVNNKLLKAKAKPLMLISALIPVVLTLLIGFLLALGLKEDMSILDEIFDSEFEMLLDGDQLKEDYEDQIEESVSIKVEDFPLVSMVVSLMHNNSYMFTEKDSLDNSEYGISVKAFFFLLIIPFISLIIGSFIFGVIGKFAKWKVQHGVIVISLVYTVFMAIISILSQYKLSIQISEDGDRYTSELIGSTPILSSIITAFALSVFVSLLIIYPLLKKNTISHSSRSIYETIRVAYYAALATVFVFIANIIYSMSAVTNELEDLIELILPSAGEGIYSLLLNIVSTIAGWGTSLFGSYTAENIPYADSDSLNVGKELFDNGVILMVITAIILIVIGYLVAKKTNVTVQQMLTFSVFFTVIQLLFVYLTAIEILDISDGDTNIQALRFEYMNILMGSFVLSFVGIFVGKILGSKKR